LKSLFCILILIFSLNSFASYKKGKDIYDSRKTFNLLSIVNIGMALVEDKLYFSAVPFFKEALYLKDDVPSKTFDVYLERLIKNVGRASFKKFPVRYLKKSNAPAMKYILGTRYYKMGKYALAIDALDKIPTDNLHFPHALMLKGKILTILGKYESAFRIYNGCINHSKMKIYDSQEGTHRMRMYQYIKDSCQIAIPRLHYKLKRFNTARTLYRAIPLESSKWPNVLLENAWANIQLKNFNRGVGSLMTLRAPLISNYFFPEGPLLTCISYYQLCLYKDLLKTVSDFLEYYKPEGRRFVDILKKKPTDRLYYYKLAAGDDYGGFSDKDFMKVVLKQMRSRPFYFSNSYFLSQTLQEIRDLKRKNQPSEFLYTLIGNVKTESMNQMDAINNYVKNFLTNLAEETLSISKEVARVRLESYAHLKEKYYKRGKVEEKEVGRGDLLNVDRKTSEQFWPFYHEFWMDELGTYTLGLASACPKPKEDD
jgi:tetratricopeptide (TPR) repeat protein